MFKVIQGGNANLKEEHQTDEPCSLKKFEAFALEVCKSKRQLKTTTIVRKTLGLQDRCRWLD